MSEREATLTQRRYDDAQGDQGPVDVGAFCQPIPAVVGVRSLAAEHAETQGTVRETSSATRGRLCPIIDQNPFLFFVFFLPSSQVHQIYLAHNLGGEVVFQNRLWER